MLFIGVMFMDVDIDKAIIIESTSIYRHYRKMDIYQFINFCVYCVVDLDICQYVDVCFNDTISVF
jgi:ribosomal protein S26